jgi:hypothetical protein
MSVFEPLAEKVPLAPLDGAVNVTGVPAVWVVIGQPFVFANVTWSISANGWYSLAVCGVPPTRIIVFGGFEVGQASAPAGAAFVETRPIKAAKPSTTARRKSTRYIVARW